MTGFAVERGNRQVGRTRLTGLLGAVVDLGDFHSNYVTVEPSDGVAIVRFSTPRLSEDENIDQLGHDLTALVDQYAVRRMVVVLAGITYLTSSAMGKLITLHRKMHRAEGIVAFARPEPTVAEILTASRLDTYLKVCPTVESAIQATGK